MDLTARYARYTLLPRLILMDEKFIRRLSIWNYPRTNFHHGLDKNRVFILFKADRARSQNWVKIEITRDTSVKHK